MDVVELYRRFPSIPADLRDEPILTDFAHCMDRWLKLARPPSACAQVHDVTHRYFLKLVGPMEIYGYGLATREETLEGIRRLCGLCRESQERFEATFRETDGRSSGNTSEKHEPSPSSDST